MWSIRKVKQVARARVKANYWKSVLVSGLFSGLVGGTGYIGTQISNSTSPEGTANFQEAWNNISSDPETMFVFFGILAIGMLIGFTIGLIIGFVLDAFLYNPLNVGITRFSYRNLREEAKVREIAYGFDHSYKNIARVMFFRELYIFLWGLLFIIPGIYKSYQYRLVPYLLTENPDMDKDTALQESKRMMDGNKGKAFLMDLSFIGWDILCVVTFGIVAIFYVAPYRTMANAALYDAVKYDKGMMA